MTDPGRARIEVFQDRERLNSALAGELGKAVAETLRARPAFTLVLSGGRSPRSLYQHLAGLDLPWEQLQFFWGDERFVPRGDARSNYALARDALFDRLDSRLTLHPMATDLEDAQQAALAYEAKLRRLFQDRRPSFDLVLLGIGSDGHTASLFPGAFPAHTERWVLATRSPLAPPWRLTLTLPLINQARRVYFLALGKEKAAAICRALGSEDAACPASLVRPRGELVWWLDEGAAASLRQQRHRS